MAGKNQYLEHLGAVPLFSACSRKELQSIARITTEMPVPAGAALIEQGDSGRECFVVVEGTLTVKRNGRKVAELGPGACVGELALLDRGPRTATVTTATPGRVLVLSTREFASLIDQIPSVATKLLRTLAAKVRELDKQLYG